MSQKVVRAVTLDPKRGPVVCLMCSAYATVEVLTALDGIRTREVFCDDCLKKRK